MGRRVRSVGRGFGQVDRQGHLLRRSEGSLMATIGSLGTTETSDISKEAFRQALLAYDASLYTGTYADQQRLLIASIAAGVAWRRARGES
jgi:hypothetical protein